MLITWFITALLGMGVHDALYNSRSKSKSASTIRKEGEDYIYNWKVKYGACEPGFKFRNNEDRETDERAKREWKEKSANWF